MKIRSFFKIAVALVAAKQIAVNISAPVVVRLKGVFTSYTREPDLRDLIHTPDEYLTRQAHLIIKQIDKELVRQCHEEIKNGKYKNYE